MKPTFIQEKKKPCITHILFKKRLIYSIENGKYDQEAHLITTTPSELKVDSHDTEKTDLNPISNLEFTSESLSYFRMCNTIKDTSDLVPDKYFLKNVPDVSI